MPIDFTCPHCGKQTTVADQFAGRTGPCAGCGQTITIPTAAVAPAFTDAGPAPLPKSSSNRWLIPLIVIAATIAPLLICGGLLAALLLPAI
jgi:hypothetical protein